MLTALAQLRPECWKRTPSKLASCWAWNVSGSQSVNSRRNFLVWFYFIYSRIEYVLSPLVCVEIRPQDTDPGGWDLRGRGCEALEAPPSVVYSALCCSSSVAHSAWPTCWCSHWGDTLSQPKAFSFKHLFHSMPPGTRLPQCCWVPSDWEKNTTLLWSISLSQRASYVNTIIGTKLPWHLSRNILPVCGCSLHVDVPF